MWWAYSAYPYMDNIRRLNVGILELRTVYTTCTSYQFNTWCVAMYKSFSINNYSRWLLVDYIMLILQAMESWLGAKNKAMVMALNTFPFT